MAQIVQTQHNGGEEQQAASQAKEQVQQAAGQAKQQARSKAREQMDRRSTEAGQRVRSQASDIRSVAEQLRQQGKDQPAKVADQAADRIERAGSWLEQADADRMLRDIEDFARRQPWAVALGGAALGFAAARFLKASSSDRYEQRFSGSSYPGTGSVGGGHATGYGQGVTADVTVEPPRAPATSGGPR
jgi:hypothetical protein